MNRSNCQNYDSDYLDESENERPAGKKRKLSKKAEAALKAKEKAKKKKKRGEEDDSSEDEYTALSRAANGNRNASSDARPPNGSFETCAKCDKQFTVVSTVHPSRSA